MRGTVTRLAKLFVLAVLALAVSASSGAAASRTRLPLLGIVPHASSQHAAGRLAATTDLALQESPCTMASTPFPCWTMRTNTTYAIYWVPSGYSVDSGYESLINRYFADVAAASGSQTNVYSVATQYYDDVASIENRSSFGGSYVDTDSFPASGCNVGAGITCLTDAQIREELQQVMTTKGWHASPTTVFFVMTPKGVASCQDGGGVACSTNRYCAYHSGFFAVTNEPILYANEPYDAAIAGCHRTLFSPNGDDADAELNTISHEHNEAITDPVGDAWLSPSGEEIGDLCSWTFGPQLGTATNGQPYNQVINGHQYWVQEEYSNEVSNCVQSYTPTVPPSNVALPVLSGAAGVGRLLSTTDGAWKRGPTAYAYQWQRCAADGSGCADISGATAASYRLGADDVRHVVRSEVSAHNAAGTSGYATSAATGVVVPVPVATAAPRLSGTATVGRKLAATAGAWNGTVTASYEWLRCAADGSACRTIAGATRATHVLKAADRGHTIEVRVTVTNAAGTATAVSNRSRVVLALPAARKAPRILGRARLGRRLSASRGSWSGSPRSYRYQWLRCNPRGKSCASIGHATRVRYRVTQRDAGHKLRVRVTAVARGGKSTASSRATAKVR